MVVKKDAEEGERSQALIIRVLKHDFAVGKGSFDMAR